MKIDRQDFGIVLGVIEFLISILGIWTGTIYSAKYLGKNFIIKDHKKIITLAITYFAVLQGGYSIYQSIKSNFNTLWTIGGLIAVAIETLVFFFVSKKYLKDTDKNEKSVTKDEKNQLSEATNIAAFALILLSVPGFIRTFQWLTGQIITASTIRSMISQLIYSGIAVFSILSLIAGIFMLKHKKWAYFLALALTFVVLAFSIIFLSLVEASIMWVIIIVPILILLFLVLASKDFKKK